MREDKSWYVMIPLKEVTIQVLKQLPSRKVILLPDKIYDEGVAHKVAHKPWWIELDC